MNTDPWTLYWQAGHAESCIAARHADDARPITGFWRALAAGLPDNAEVLDLACGNGAVAAHLLAAKPTLRISGVDKAAIAPTEFPREPGRLNKVSFLPETDLAALPFPNDTFDMVTSQFGLEYADFDRAGPEAARVLRRGGGIGLLLHHADSELVRPCRRRIREIDGLLAPAGVMEAAGQLLGGTISLEQLEARGREYLDSGEDRTRPISGRIFEGIERLIRLLETDTAAARELAATMAATMDRRLRADRQRLEQMAQAALDRPALQERIERFAALGITVESAEPLLIDEPDGGGTPLAWRLSGVKTGETSEKAEPRRD